MYRNRTVREIVRLHAQEIARRDEMIQTLLDRIQAPERVPIWREPMVVDQEPVFDPWAQVPDPEQLP